MPEDGQPATPASNVVLFPGKAARPSASTASDPGAAATILASAARNLELALEHQHAALLDWCRTVKALVTTADTLAGNLRILHEQSRPTVPPATGQDGADEP